MYMHTPYYTQVRTYTHTHTTPETACQAGPLTRGIALNYKYQPMQVSNYIYFNTVEN